MKLISLACDEDSLKLIPDKAVDNGAPTADVIERNIALISLYKKLYTIKIDTSNKSLETVMNELAAL